MSRVCKKKPSPCTDEPLAQNETRQKLTLLRNVLSSSYGPFGGLKQIHNAVGGSVRTTSTSSVLLKAMTFSEPLLKLITTAILKHTTRFSDCGLFAGIFCLDLIGNAKKVELSAHLASRVYKHLLDKCNEYLRADDCGCKVQVDLDSIHTLLALASSVVASKGACMLTAPEVQHISSLIVKAFLQSVPSHSSGTVCFGRTLTVPLEGQLVSTSALFSGLLVDVPELQSSDLKKLGPGPYKVVLFNISLSGDLSEMGDAVVEIRGTVNPEALLVDQLLKMGEQVVKDGVDVFACQKVVHPVLQQYLKDHGLMVVERLGLALAEIVAQLTGALMVSSLYSPVPRQAYGQVERLQFHRFGPKKMLQMFPSGEAVINTMVLCQRNETMLDELKVTCQKAEHVLRLALKEPYALLGGGCTETLLSAYIRYESQLKASEAADALNCSRAEFLLCVEAFLSSLKSVALSLEHDGQHCVMDMTHAHRWLSTGDEDSQIVSQQTCSCGQVKYSQGLETIPLNTEYHSFRPAPLESYSHPPRLLDSLAAKLNAFNVAVETASLVLGVACVIRDLN